MPSLNTKLSWNILIDSNSIWELEGEQEEKNKRKEGKQIRKNRDTKLNHPLGSRISLLPYHPCPSSTTIALSPDCFRIYIRNERERVGQEEVNKTKGNTCKYEATS